MDSTQQAPAAARKLYEERYANPRSDVIELGRVTDFLLALNQPLPDPAKPVPPLFLMTLGHVRRPAQSAGGAVNAGNAFEFFAPVYVGDCITTSSQLVSLEAKHGSKGLMTLTRVGLSFTNQNGTRVARSEFGILRWGI